MFCKGKTVAILCSFCVLLFIAAPVYKRLPKPLPITNPEKTAEEVSSSKSEAATFTSLSLKQFDKKMAVAEFYGVHKLLNNVFTTLQLGAGSADGKVEEVKQCRDNTYPFFIKYAQLRPLSKTLNDLLILLDQSYSYCNNWYNSYVAWEQRAEALKKEGTFQFNVATPYALEQKFVYGMTLLDFADHFKTSVHKFELEAWPTPEAQAKLDSLKNEESEKQINDKNTPDKK